MSTVESESRTSLQSTGNGQQIIVAGDNSLPEAYHLEGSGNYGVWSYLMKNLLQRDGRFKYCTTLAPEIMSDEERMARQQVMSLINSSAKNNALRILRRYIDPYECWTGLKTRMNLIADQDE